jgi:hypothetical protein
MHTFDVSIESNARIALFELLKLAQQTVAYLLDHRGVAAWLIQGLKRKRKRSKQLRPAIMMSGSHFIQRCGEPLDPFLITVQ